METNRLRQFCVIAETGSITKAAELLHITHSGLSKSMKLLQDELSCVVFRTAGRGLVLTSEGADLYQRAKLFLQQEEQLFKKNKTKNEMMSTVKLGAAEVFLLGMSEQLKHYPCDQTAITLLDLEPETIEQQIIDKKIDFGITYAPFPNEKLNIIEVGQYRLGCYHANANFHDQALTEIPFVVPACAISANSFGITARDGWPDSLFSRHKKYAVNLLSTALELTLQGLCAIYIPDFVARKINNDTLPEKKLIEFPLPHEHHHTQNVYLIHHKEQKNKTKCFTLQKMVQRLIAA